MWFLKVKNMENLFNTELRGKSDVYSVCSKTDFCLFLRQSI